MNKYKGKYINVYPINGGIKKTYSDCFFSVSYCRFTTILFKQQNKIYLQNDIRIYIIIYLLIGFQFDIRKRI